MRPLHGFSDAEDASWRTLRMFLIEALKLTQYVDDPCLFYVRETTRPSFISV